MGVDIHMHIVKDGKIVLKDIYEGRNGEWFDNIDPSSYFTHNDNYIKFPSYLGISEQAPSTDEFNEKKLDSLGYYHFSFVNVGEFRKWFEEYRPDIDAGWVNTYTKWRIENKGYIPDEVQRYLYEEDIIADMHFIEYTNEYEPSKRLYDFLDINKIDDDADITYWFDN